MSVSNGFNVKVELLENYVFKVDFGDFGDIITDEPAPLGSGEGPNPARLLGAAVGNCLCASLLFALRKQKDNPAGISAEVEGSLERQEGLWRIANLKVQLKIDNASTLPHLSQALEQFENFCIVTQSVRQGIAVDVTVVDQQGNQINP